MPRDTSDGGPAVLVGLPWAEGPFVYNAVAYLDHGRIESVRLKYNLPNYGVFDEKRVFAPGPLPAPIEVRGVLLGVPVCEDIWSEEACQALAKAGAGLLIVPNGSPYWMDKQGQRYSIARSRVAETGLPLAYINQVGGQDELVFDGASFVLNADGSLAVQMPAWEEACGVTEWRRDGNRWRCEPQPARRDRAGRCRQLPRLRLRACATMWTRTASPAWCSGFPAASTRRSARPWPSMRSAPKRVHGVMLPYTFTSNESLNDAAETAQALGVRYDIMPIHPAVGGPRPRASPRSPTAAMQARRRRICSRAPAARCSWASPTNSGRW